MAIAFDGASVADSDQQPTTSSSNSSSNSSLTDGPPIQPLPGQVVPPGVPPSTPATPAPALQPGAPAFAFGVQPPAPAPEPAHEPLNIGDTFLHLRMVAEMMVEEYDAQMEQADEGVEDEDDDDDDDDGDGNLNTFGCPLCLMVKVILKNRL